MCDGRRDDTRGECKARGKSCSLLSHDLCLSSSSSTMALDKILSAHLYLPSFSSTSRPRRPLSRGLGSLAAKVGVAPRGRCQRRRGLGQGVSGTRSDSREEWALACGVWTKV